MARITVSVGRDPPRVWTDGAAPAARPATAPAIDVQARAFFAQRRPSRTHGLTPGAGGDRFSGTARAGEGRWAALLLAGVGTVPPGQGRGWLDGGEWGLTQGPELGRSLPSGFLSPRGVSSLSVCLLPAGGWGAEKGPPGHTLPWGCPAAPFLWISETEAHRLTELLPQLLNLEWDPHRERWVSIPLLEQPPFFPETWGNPAPTETRGCPGRVCRAGALWATWLQTWGARCSYRVPGHSPPLNPVPWLVAMDTVEARPRSLQARGPSRCGCTDPRRGVALGVSWRRALHGGRWQRRGQRPSPLASVWGSGAGSSRPGAPRRSASALSSPSDHALALQLLADPSSHRFQGPHPVSGPY